MDNQQERPLGLEYVGGLAVGEGCFYLALSRIKNKRPRIVPGFRLIMNDHESIDAAAGILREHGLPVYITGVRRDGGKGIHASGFLRVERYAKALLPFLTGKKKQAAELVLEFIEDRKRSTRNAPYTEWQIACVERLRQTNGNGNFKKNPVGILRGHTSDIG